MGELIVRNDGQLRRVDHAIKAIECRSICDQMRMHALLQALYAERAELGKYQRATRCAA
jgi:hypothetical protein